MEHYLRHGEAFLVHYGDILTDQNLTEMFRFHNAKRSLVTLLLHQRNRSNSVVSIDKDGQIIDFLERPGETVRSNVDSPWVNSGVCICAPELFDYIPVDVPCDLPRDIFTKLVASGQLYGFTLDGYRCAVDSPQRLAEARAAVTGGRLNIT